MQQLFDFMLRPSPDSHRVAWAAGFFDGEGCISIAKPINKRKSGKSYITYALQAIVAQRSRRPMEVLVGLFGGNITSVKIHGSIYWYLRLHGHKASGMLEQLLPFLVLKKEQAELAIQFQQYYDKTRPYSRAVGRNPEEMETLEMFYQQSKQFNARFKQMDYTQVGKENGQLTN